LLYQKTYYIRVDSEQSDPIDIGQLSTSSDLSQEIRIPMEQDLDRIFSSIVSLEKQWTGSGFQVTYEDLTSSTQVVNFTVYYQTNKTRVYSNDQNNKNNHIFTFEHDAVFRNDWVFTINTTIDSADDSFDGEYKSGFILMSPYNETDKRDDIDSIWDIIFGDSPVYDYEGAKGGAEVPWTYILLFSVAFLFLLTFSKVNAFAGALGSGLILIFGGVTVLGLNTAYHWYNWWDGPSIVVIGMFILAVGIIGLMGKVDIRRY
jgi:hypothetical protein